MKNMLFKALRTFSLPLEGESKKILKDEVFELNVRAQTFKKDLDQVRGLCKLGGCEATEKALTKKPAELKPEPKEEPKPKAKRQRARRNKAAPKK